MIESTWEPNFAELLNPLNPDKKKLRRKQERKKKKEVRSYNGKSRDL